MDNYSEYIKENKKITLDGKNGFFMFLTLIDDMKMNFIKSNNYLNTGKYQYFFTTENVRKKDNFVQIFDDLMSLNITCRTAQKIKDIRMSFYFGIKDNILEYGFHDDMKTQIYKTGEFEVNSNYIKKLKSYKCLSLIEDVLKKCNLNNLNILQSIKKDFKNWVPNLGYILILNENVIKKSIDKKEIKDENENLLYKYENWCKDFSWFNKVYYYIDENDNDDITFYIKVKPKKDKDK